MWKPLLIILPVGLALGVLGARMVGSDATRSNEQEDASSPSASEPYDALSDPPADRGYYATERPGDVRRGNEYGGSDDRYGPERPDPNWDQERWPRDYDRGAYSYDDRYFGENDDTQGWIQYGERRSDDTRMGPRGSAGGRGRAGSARDEAEEAALAAQRAAREVTAQVDAAPSATAPGPASVTRAPATAPRAAPAPEPRAGEGDLPAIY